MATHAWDRQTYAVCQALLIGTRLIGTFPFFYFINLLPLFNEIHNFILMIQSFIH